TINLRRVILRDIEFPPFDWPCRSVNIGDVALFEALRRVSMTVGLAIECLDHPELRIIPLILLLLRRLHEAYLRFEENEYPIWPQLEFVRFVKPGHATVLLSTYPFFRRNDRQQQIRRLGAAKIQARNAVKNRWWPI